MAFSRYQKGGFIDWVDPHCAPAFEEISRGAGAPNIRMWCYQKTGVGKHKVGRACDFQGGVGPSYPHAKAVHQAIANYTLANWGRLKIRYMAWNGYEWLGNAVRRPQARNYGGTDPWHKNHVHVDIIDGAIPNANGAMQPVPPSPSNPAPRPNPGVGSTYYKGSTNGKTSSAMWTAWQQFLAHRGYYSGSPNGKPDGKLWTAVQSFLKDYGYYSRSPNGKQDAETGKAVQRWLSRTGNYKGSINGAWNATLWSALQKYLSYATVNTSTPLSSGPNTTPPAQAGPTPTPEKAPSPKKKGPFLALTDKQQASLYKQTMNISAAVNRNEQRNKQLLTAATQTNEILLGILAQLSDPSNPNTALEDKVFRLNNSINASTSAHDAGMTVFNYDPPLDADPEDDITPPDPVE